MFNFNEKQKFSKRGIGSPNIPYFIAEEISEVFDNNDTSEKISHLAVINSLGMMERLNNEISYNSGRSPRNRMAQRSDHLALA
jgi:hypothetical protein